MISARLSARLPIFATTGIGRFTVCFLALFRGLSGHAFIIEPTARYVVVFLPRAVRLGAGLSPVI